MIAVPMWTIVVLIVAMICLALWSIRIERLLRRSWDREVKLHAIMDAMDKRIDKPQQIFRDRPTETGL